MFPQTCGNPPCPGRPLAREHSRGYSCAGIHIPTFAYYYVLRGHPTGSTDRDSDFYCLHSEICKTLANEKRQRILDALRGGGLTVTELQQATGIAQANLSQHLAVLRTKGVVLANRNGSHVRYSISNPKIIQAFDLISEVMAEAYGERKDVIDAALGSRKA
jgi:DNA-binding transcriptional ArsR family regulator